MPRDLLSLLARPAREAPEGRALVCDDRSVSYAELDSRVDRLASALVDRGCRPGDRVALLARTSIGYVELLLAALRAGACATPLPTLDPAAVARMLQDAAPAALALDHACRPLADRCRLPGLCVALDFEAHGWTPLEELACARPPLPTPPRAIPPDAPCNIIYSSGTTGEPRGIVHAHRMRALQIERMARLGLGPGVVLVCTPLYSNATLITLLPALALGGTAVLMPRFEVRAFLELAERERVTHTMLVPVQAQRLLACPDLDRFDLAAFRAKLCTGAPLSAPLKRALLERWPGALLEIYGQTEGGPTTILDAARTPDKLATVGQPAPGVDLRILDPEGRELPCGEAGEIVGRAPTMMSGYHGRPDLTEAITWRDPQGRAFFRTGDIGFLDGDGFLHLLDRKKDVIISGGFNIYPVDLEQVLARHPAVAEAAVIGVPCERWGETPLALVVPRPDATPSPQDLLAWANGQLGSVQRIARLELVDALPRGPTGKLLRRALRARHSRPGGDMLATSGPGDHTRRQP